MDPRKKLVRDCYDGDGWREQNRSRVRDFRCSTPTTADRGRERAWYERFALALPRGARVLDLGCGDGKPLLADLIARGHRTVGVDLAHEQLVHTRVACPAAALIEADMAEVDFADASFDGIVSYHAIWNLPRQEHAALFARARRWLVEGGTALFTLGAIADDQNGELFTELAGAPTYYDAFSADTSLRLVREAGFAIEGYDRPVLDGVAGGVLFVLARAT